MRHRHVPRATALLPCVAVLLVTPLTSAAHGPGVRHHDRPCPVVRTQLPAKLTAAVTGFALDEAGTEDASLDAAVLDAARVNEAGINEARLNETRIDLAETGGGARTDHANKDDAVTDDANGAVPVRTRTDDTHRPAAKPDREPSTSPDQQSSRRPGRHGSGTAAPRKSAGPGRENREQRRDSTPQPHSSGSSARRSAGGSPSAARPDGQAEQTEPPTAARRDAPESGSPDRTHAAGGTDSGTGKDSGTGEDPGTGTFGTHDLYAPDHPGLDTGARPGGAPTTAATGEVSPVLPLGAGLASIGLGLAFLALRLRRG
ncbi:MAG: hypothetical protein ACRDP3_01265 [Streptomyces sp.]|uniref:hypothetical protein n=1 Tax=Streptomyces sp. TaxID=1931 RepID=UPI003D6BA4B3